MDEEAPVSADFRCPECGRRARESRFQPGSFYQDHSGRCSHNGALHPCKRCGQRHVDMTFDRVLACIMELPLDEAREMQARIVARLRS